MFSPATDVVCDPHPDPLSTRRAGDSTDILLFELRMLIVSEHLLAEALQLDVCTSNSPLATASLIPFICFQDRLDPSPRPRRCRAARLASSPDSESDELESTFAKTRLRALGGITGSKSEARRPGDEERPEIGEDEREVGREVGREDEGGLDGLS